MFVGNGLDRSGIDAVTAMLNKISIEYTTVRFEPEQASRFPTTSFRVFINFRAACDDNHIYSLLFILCSACIALPPLYKTSFAIRITHIPTGTVIECQDERSQYKNKDKALKFLKSHLLKEKQDAQASEIAVNRKSQVGTGDRSERIRTYNFPQGRLTDHRIGLTLYKQEDIINDNLDEVIDALVTADRAKKLKESIEN